MVLIVNKLNLIIFLYFSGAGPGGGCINGGAGHGGMGIPFIRHKGVLYGWSYGFNTSHIELTGGSSGRYGVPFDNSSVDPPFHLFVRSFFFLA